MERAGEWFKFFKQTDEQAVQLTRAFVPLDLIKQFCDDKIRELHAFDAQRIKK